MASALNNMGVIYLNIADYKRAIEYSLRSQKIQEEIRDSSILFESYYNTGLLFKDINDLEKSLQCFQKAYNTAAHEKNFAKMGFALNGIGGIVKRHKQYDSARKLYSLALSYFRKEKNMQGVLESYTNLGSLSADRKDIPVKTGAREALSYYFRAQSVFKEFKNNFSGSDIAGNIAFGYLKLQKYDSAVYYAKKAIDLAKISDNQSELIYAYKVISDAYRAKGDYKQSLEYLDLHDKLRDVVFNAEKQKEIIQKQLQYEFDKKMLADSLLRMEEKKTSETKIELANTKLKQEKYLRYFLIVGIVFVIVFMYFLYNRFKAIKEKNIIIEEQKQQVIHQKEIIEVKQNEILSSLNYAERIQRTLMVKEKELTSYFNDHFIVFKPKDIVSGDFYWSVKKDNLFYIACCDCTGHGVPGAFMSLLNIGFLTEAMNEKNIVQPNEIFNYVRARLIESVSQDGAQDGMDGILICFDTNSNQVTYAAANNSPVLISDDGLTHLPADKMPVGQGIKKESFNLYTFSKNQAKSLVLYTDGFADQFGGPKGKKFKYRQLDELLFSMKDHPFALQAQKLEAAFSKWKGALEQVDDVCVIGIKI